MSSYVLYDIPTAEPRKCWSPNTWKARSVLNFKNLPYETKWVEYPDIKEVAQDLGFSPHENTDTLYTCPMLIVSDGTKFMESMEIIEYLEKQHPTPSLHLQDPMLPRFREVQMSMREAFVGFVIPKIPKVLAPRSRDYFNETREKDFGMPLAEVEKKAIEDGVWDKLKAGCEKLKDLLSEKEGPFLMGETPSYADLVLTGLMDWTEIGSKEMFDFMLQNAGKPLQDHWAATEEWRKRNDH